jgi:bifunctional UDP-N-acetylglucosamine pyrophosphorylase/glucosamine-1-phosphate N-acetyltransferase
MAAGWYAVVLAAGKGTRMKSDRAKVLHEVFFAPMVHHVLEALQPLFLAGTYVVTGHQHEAVEAALVSYAPSFVYQETQGGTGHAVLMTEAELAGRQGTVLILCGDTPLIRPETLQGMVAAHEAGGSSLTVMTTVLENPTHYGRIVTDKVGRVVAVVEEKDATPEQRQITEINAGIYCVDIAFLFAALKGVGTGNAQGEMYLTDIVAIANRDGHQVNRYVCADCFEVLGVNSRVELAQAHASLQMRRNVELMLAGVTLIHPETIAIERSATIGRDTVIQPNVTISGPTEIGQGCRIDASVTIRGCRIGDGASIGPLCVLDGATIAPGEQVPPHTLLFRVG